MKRKALALILTVSLACTFALTGCGIGGSGVSQKMPQMEASVDKVFTTGGGYDNKTFLVINLNVKNNTDTNMPSGVIQMYASANLDGQPLSSDYLPYDNPSAIDVLSSIAPGATGVAQLVFALPDTRGTVQLMIAVDNLDYSAVVDIVNESFNLADVEALVSESEFDVSIDDAIVTDDGEGKDIIVLKISFTNNSDSATSFGSAIDTQLFQNDVALKSTYLPYNHPLTDRDLGSNSYTDIRNGASIELQLVYELHDKTNPIEIKLVDRQSFDNKVLLEKTISVKGT